MSRLSELFVLLLLSSAASGTQPALVLSLNQGFGYANWSSAQAFCKRTSKDLATFYTQSEADSASMAPYYVWVGLRTATLNQWNWVNGEPLNLSRLQIGQLFLNTTCGYYSYGDKKFYGSDCGSYYFFICSKLNTNKTYDFTFINESMTWNDAQLFCKAAYDDLAVSENDGLLQRAVNQQDFPAWIGLHREGQTWKWSSGISDFRNWAPGEPGSEGDCVAMSSQRKTMMMKSCSASLPYVCYQDNLLLVKENKTWEEALEYCNSIPYSSPNRGPYQLVSVQPGEEFSYMINKAMEADTDEVWTGLRYLAGNWFWTDRADILLPDLLRCPLDGQHCGAFSKSNKDGLITRDCSEPKNFLCYKQER